MNNNKKIIRTLRNADKASVERLMAEEAKKNEIFAKAQQRANIEQSGYADSVSGVEKYDRRISMTRIASIAAAAVLIMGSIGGGAYMMRNNNDDPVIPGPVEPATTAETNTETSSTVETTTETSSTVSTGTDTTINDTSETTAADYTVSGEGSLEFSVTKEELIEKVMYNSVNYFDKFSADYTAQINERREFHTEPEILTGKIYLDEVAMTASATVERYENEQLIGRSLIAIMDNYYYDAEESLVETDFVNGGYKFLETPDKYYYVKDQNTNKVFITPRGRTMNIDVNAPENWDITGERTENGRKIISISGVQKGDNNYEGVYREIPYFMEVDAETGMTLSYDEYDSEGNMTSSYKMTNYKFDDDAVEFRTASDIISEIENGGFRKM
ncbi:MAG: hypothetical protein IKW87_00965 [Ruminococcus sp.]|nr:hypothetical protein [Ruminococcus sp.]